MKTWPAELRVLIPALRLAMASRRKRDERLERSPHDRMGTEIGSDKGRLLTRANLELVCGISNFPFSIVQKQGADTIDRYPFHGSPGYSPPLILRGSASVPQKLYDRSMVKTSRSDAACGREMGVKLFKVSVRMMR